MRNLGDALSVRTLAKLLGNAVARFCWSAVAVAPLALRLCVSCLLRFCSVAVEGERRAALYELVHSPRFRIIRIR